MLSYLYSHVTGINLGQAVKYSKKRKPNYIYREELDKKSTSPSMPRRRAYKDAKAKIPLLQREVQEKTKFLDRESTLNQNKEKKELRIKVLMTKEEAVRLLSKCKQGGILEFKDVVNELGKTTPNRVRVVDSSSNIGSDCTLGTIAEEI